MISYAWTSLSINGNNFMITIILLLFLARVWPWPFSILHFLRCLRNQVFSVFVRPEVIQINQYTNHCVTFTTGNMKNIWLFFDTSLEQELHVINKKWCFVFTCAYFSLMTFSPIKILVYIWWNRINFTVNYIYGSWNTLSLTPHRQKFFPLVISLLRSSWVILSG